MLAGAVGWRLGRLQPDLRSGRTHLCLPGSPKIYYTIIPTLTSQQYGYPLAAYGRFINQLPINNVTHTRELATASSRAVVRPNADTLYSTVPYDLTKNDLIISFGKLDNWYWLFSFYDP